MTLSIFGYRIEIIKIEKPQPVQIDREAAKREAEAIKNSERFQAIKQQAQALRSARNDR